MIAYRDPRRNAVLTEKRKATLMEKYGVDNVSKLSDVKAKISASARDRESYLEEKSARLADKRRNHSPIIRKCAICGLEFEASGSQSICKRSHYRTCVICGKKFECNLTSSSTQTCSRACQAQLRKTTVTSTQRICEYCGKPFYSASSTAKYCEGPHYKKCVICGAEFEITSDVLGSKYAPSTCSEACKQKLIVQTNLSKYGAEHASQLPESRAHNRDKALQNADKTKNTNLERYGYPFAVQHPSIRKKLSEKTSDPEVIAKTRATTLERYGVSYVMQSPEIARLHSNSQFQTEAMDGTRVDSSWERDVYNFLLRNGIDFKYNTYSIPFQYNGSEHVTHIDFKIGDLLLEVKGSHLLEGTYSDAPGVIPIDVKLQLYREHHVVVVTDDTCRNMFGHPNSLESNGLKYLNKCPNPLIGVDVTLFNNPAFPYADDRPPCFYKVKVDGKPSSLTAFYDDLIRWKMILNRIQYTGGFIDAKQVLTAMNVTRTCKQPSWFSKTLAKQVIQDYCTSTTIVDPFAGWGMRHDAAIELGREYVGSDLNAELVQWHQEHGRNITLADAKTFRYNQECSVFICPPYSDPKTGRCFEDYSFEGFDSSAKSLSQCDWLKIVMNNVPNASEYVMVCKIVDDDFKDNIVQTIENKSHFGTNYEYVVVVNR